MENKGLCSTCVYDAECTLHRIFPVTFCEEFSGIEPKPKEKEDRKQEKAD